MMKSAAALPSQPSRPWLYGGVFLLFVSMTLLVIATALPRFASVGLRSSGGDMGSPTSLTVHLGAFQLCVEGSLGGLGVMSSMCGAVDGSCAISGFGANGGSQMIPHCSAFNAFRVMLVMASVLGGLGLLAALAHSCLASPHRYLAHSAFVLSLLAMVMSALSLVLWSSWYGSLTSAPMMMMGGSGTMMGGGMYSFSQGASFGLLVAAMLMSLLGLAIWLYGRVKQQQQGAGGGATAAVLPHYLTASTHAAYTEEEQIKQPLTQQ